MMTPKMRAFVTGLPDDAPPTLLYDLGAIEKNARALRDVSERTGVEFLFAVKAFPRAEVVRGAARLLSGFDVSNGDELELAHPNASLSIASDRTVTNRASGNVVSLACPGLEAPVLERILAQRPDAVVSCETLRQVVLARERGARAITLRLNSPTLLRTATTRALVPFPPPREALRSRFGFDTSEGQDRELAAAELSRAVHAAGEAFAGFHLHHGFAEANSPEVYLAFALAMKALAAKAGVPLPSINLGGGLWTLSFPVLERLCAEIKRAVGPGTCVRFEPGRILSREAGVAVGRVLSARTVGSTRIRLLNLSRACHVRWAHPRLLNVVPAPEGALPKLKKASAGAPRLLCVGPTCYEDDTFPEVLVGEAAEGNGRTLLPEGDTVVFGGITGYSCAWNSSFNGIPPAEVRFV